MLALRAEGRLDRLRMLDLTNCTFDGHMYNVRRVMEECLAIKPDLIFLWDEAWSGFARFSPFLRPRTAMGAAADLEAWLRDPASVDAYEAQQRQLGDNPSDEVLLATRLIPDPRRVRLRVYQTNSTHKSMSAFRQGSMLLVKDVDFHDVEAQFHEAVFTHASTSPNQQLIASLDVARRQMELEGYGLVMNAIEIALKIRMAVKSNPLISKYFRVLGADEMIPDAIPAKSGFTDYVTPGTNWADVVHAMREDEFYLDPTRMTLVCGTAGFDGTEFKGILANEYQHPGQQDVAKQRAGPIQYQQHAERRRPSDPRTGRDLPGDRKPAGIRRRRCAASLRGKGEVTDGGRARPAELQQVP